MKILGIDYGKRKIGLAIATGPVPFPYKVVKIKDFADGVKKITKIINEEEIEKVVVGVSEGEMGLESQRFAEILKAATYDETLSTHEAKKLSIESGIKQKRRKEMEDAFAASVMLQNYLEENVN